MEAFVHIGSNKGAILVLADEANSFLGKINENSRQRNSDPVTAKSILNELYNGYTYTKDLIARQDVWENPRFSFCTQGSSLLNQNILFKVIL